MNRCTRSGWNRASRALVAAAMAVAAACGTLPGQSGDAAVRGAQPAPVDPADEVVLPPRVRVDHPMLERRMRELAVRSPTWRAALDTLAQTGFPVVVAGPEGVRRGVPGLSHYRPLHFGEVIPMRDEAGAIRGAVVIVDIPRIRRVCEEAGLSEALLEEDVERILIHELYGHVVPLAQTRRIAGGCPDPAPGEPASSSCAIQRENRIRTELGVPPRTAYDLQGLHIGPHVEARGERGRRNRDARDERD